MEYHHPMDFIAEDCNAGLGLSKMGKGIRFDARSFLATEVPTTFFGPGLNWWKQRQKSWEMGRHGRIFAFIRQFLFVLPAKKSLQGILWHKLTYFYLICTNAIDWLRIPTFVALGRTADWWRNAILLMLFSAIPPLVYKYVKCRRRPDLQPRFLACVTYPWYKQIYTVVSIFGAIRCVGYYCGGHQRPLTIQQMLKKKDDGCFWLDPRFETNPAWLADEGEAQETKQSKQTKAESSSDENLDWNEVNIMDSMLEPPLATYQSPVLGSTDHILRPPTRSPLRTSPRLPPSVSPSPGMSRSASATTFATSMPPTPGSTSRTNFRPWASGLGMDEISIVSYSTPIGPPSLCSSMQALPKRETGALLHPWDQQLANGSYFDEWDQQQTQDTTVKAGNHKQPRRKLQKHRKKSSSGGSQLPI